jgi:hypothetical protein
VNREENFKYRSIDEGDSLENKRYVIEEEAFEMMASRLSLTRRPAEANATGSPL